MPLFDLLGGTPNSKSWELQKEISSAKDDQVPDFFFLAHIVDVAFSLHSPFVFRSFSSMPFSFKLWLLPLWPVAFVMMFLMWAMSKTFLLSFYNLRSQLHQTWLVPRYGFQSIVSRFDTYSISGMAYGSKGKIFNWYFAETGSGKTLAYLFPALVHVNASMIGIWRWPYCPDLDPYLGTLWSDTRRSTKIWWSHECQKYMHLWRSTKRLGTYWFVLCRLSVLI